MSLLGYERHGSGPPLVWLHGFTQTMDSAHQFRTILAANHDVLTLDLPGHGHNHARSATLDETADLVAQSVPDETFVVAGYSFGARVALHVALRHPDRVRCLVTLGASRGIEDEAQRRERRRTDDALADRIEQIGTDAFLDEWLARDMFRTQAPDPLERAARSTDASGLANSLRLAGTGTQDWLGPRLTSISAPTLALAGEYDEKFSVEAMAIARTVGRGSYEMVPGAHHAAHLERPELVAELITAFTR